MDDTKASEDVEVRSPEQKIEDLRQLLKAIAIPLETIGNLSFLAAHAAEYPEKTREYLKRLDEQVNRIGILLRDQPEAPKGR